MKNEVVRNECGIGDIPKFIKDRRNYWLSPVERADNARLIKIAWKTWNPYGEGRQADSLKMDWLLEIILKTYNFTLSFTIGLLVRRSFADQCLSWAIVTFWLHRKNLKKGSFKELKFRSSFCILKKKCLRLNNNIMEAIRRKNNTCVLEAWK